MTATNRPELLPLPQPGGDVAAGGLDWTDEEMEAYARANVERALAESRAEVVRLREDAERWRAVAGSARIRVLGSAGLHSEVDHYGNPWNGYAHIGVELWTKHEAGHEPSYAADWLEKYADAARAALSQRPVVDEAAFGDQPMSLRERISFMELEAGSLRAVERKTGVDVGYLSRLKSGDKTNPSDDTLRKLGLVRRIGYALAPQQQGECEHEWADARNRYVQSGEVCLKCHAMRAGNATAPQQPTGEEG